MKKILLVHREGNFRNNPHLWGVLQFLGAQGIAIDLLTEARPNAPTGQILPEFRALPLLDERLSQDETHRESLDLGAAFAQESQSVIEKLEGQYDHVLGVDLGVITAARLAQHFGTPHSLISYELFFGDECESRLKRIEIESCRQVRFAVCQDQLRASHLCRENEIQRSRVILMPVAGAGLRLGEKRSLLHDALSLSPEIRILVYIGDLLSDWSGVQYLADQASTIPDDWRVVLHHRYATAETKARLSRWISSFGNRILLSPFDELPPEEMGRLLHSADLGLALYLPTFSDMTSGKNIAFLGASSGKISSYLQHGLPVVVNQVGELSDLIRVYGAGFVLDETLTLGDTLAKWTAAGATGKRDRAAKLFSDRLDLLPRLPGLLHGLGSIESTRVEAPVRNNQRSPSGFLRRLGEIFSLQRKARDPRDAVAISVIVPTAGRPRSLARTLRSLCKQSLSRHLYEILVVENGPEASSSALVRSLAKRYRRHLIRYIHEPSPGLLAGRHRGVVEAEAPLLVFVDDDIEASRGWLEALVESFAQTSAQLVTGPSLPRFEGWPPSWLKSRWSTTPNGGLACGDLSLLDLGDERMPIDANLVWGLNFAIRRTALFDLGGFHPDLMPRQLQRFQGDGETGLTRKATEAGLLAIYEPAARVRHRIPRKRLTPSYFLERAFYQGICDSYTTIRGQPDGFDTSTVSRTDAPERIPTTDPKILESRISAVDLGRAISQAYEGGIRFHRQSLESDRELLKWITRPQYWDYRIPSPIARGARLVPEESAGPAIPDVAVQRIDFRIPGFPTFLERAVGLSFCEPWGRWTDGPSVEFHSRRPLPRRLRLTIVAWAFQENAKHPVRVSAGASFKDLAVDGEPMRAYSVLLEPGSGVRLLRIEIPAPTSPTTLWPGRSSETRRLGLALQSIEICDEAAASP